MNRRLVLAATLLVLPTAAFAQRGGGTRSRAAEHDEMFGQDSTPKGPSLRTRDVEDFSPIHMLIDKHKDLKLSDAQVDGLKKSEQSLREKNAPLLKALDSLVREMRPPLNSTDESRAHIRDAGIALHETLQSISANYDAAFKEATSSYDADQQAKANELYAKLKEEGEKRVGEKMGGGRRG